MSKSVFVLLFILSLDTIAGHLNIKKDSYNSIGNTGLIHLPSGNIQKEGSLGVTIGNSSLNQFFSVVATPFSWLETSYFYHRPQDSYFIKKGNYLDKGFNLKILLLSFEELNISVGIDDIAGTGYLSKEYLAGTLNSEKYKLTLGIGTGAFSRDNPYKNPIKSLQKRPRASFIDPNSRGGTIDFNAFFKGPIGLFGGFEYFPTKFPNLSIQIESNPYDYKYFLSGGSPLPKSQRLREKKKNYNLGFRYLFKNDFSLTLSQIKGNGFDLSFSKKFNFNGAAKPLKKIQVKELSRSNNNKHAFYQNILKNLARDGLYLQAANLKSGDLDLSIVNSRYNNHNLLFSHVNLVTKELANIHSFNINSLTIVDVASGIETSKMTAKTATPCNINVLSDINYTAPLNNTDQYEYQTTLNFPEYYYSIKPQLIYRYGDPDRFFAAGLDIVLNLEINFMSNIYLKTQTSYQVSNTFDRLRDISDSDYLPHVRSDYIKYLNNRSDLYINQFQLDYIDKIRNDHYFKLSAGMVEMMFGGFGLEYLWAPHNLNTAIGSELYRLKQRDFYQELNFRDYEVTTGHFNFIYKLGKSGIILDMGIGRYLAKDIGYTLDFSKTFKSGYKMGAYFTRTNASKIEYGEGSFDKGFYFEIPLNRTKGKETILIQPLTRDGGAKLKLLNPLKQSIIYKTSRHQDLLF